MENETSVDCHSIVQNVQEESPKLFVDVLLFAYFWGVFGAHRFYTGYRKSAIIQALSLGGLGIWAYIDFILICFNKFKDVNGLKLKDYSRKIGVLTFVLSIALPLLALILVVGILVVLIIMVQSKTLTPIQHFSF